MTTTQVAPFDLTDDEEASLPTIPPPPPSNTSTSHPKRILRCILTKPKYGSWYLLLDIVLIISIMLMMYEDLYIEKHAQIQSILRDVGKTDLDNVNDAASFYKWMIDSMIPDADASLKSTKGQHFASIPGFQIMYDTPIMITGFRLYQDRNDKATLCSKKIALAKNPNVLNTLLFLGIDCSDEQANAYPYGHVIHSNGTVQKQCPHPFFRSFGWNLTEHSPFELTNVVTTKVNPITQTRIEDEKYMVDMIDTTTIKHLQDCAWIDTRTTTITVHCDVLISIHAAFGEMAITFEFDEFGGVNNVKRKINFVALTNSIRDAEYNLGSGMWSDDDMVFYVGSFVCIPLSMIKFFTMLVGFFKDFLDGWKRSKKKEKKTMCHCFHRISQFVSVAMFLDLLYIYMMVTWFIDSFRYTIQNIAMYEIVGKAGAEVMAIPVMEGGGKVLSQSWLMTWSKYFEEINVLMQSTMVAVNNKKNGYALFAFVTFLELMRHFSGNKRLSIVPRSLAVSAGDIGYLLIVLSSITFIFAIILSVWYGEQFIQFSTLWSTIVHLVLMTLGEWSDDYWDIYNNCDDPKMFFFMFVSYCLLVIIVVMNMVLAVVLDSYAQVKEFHLNEESKEKEMKENSEEEWQQYKKKKAKESMMMLMMRVKGSKAKGQGTHGVVMNL